MKKIPAQSPYTASLKPESSFIWSAANPTLTRSRNATMYRTNMNEMRRRVTFAKVACATALAALPTRLPSSLLDVDDQPRVSNWFFLFRCWESQSLRSVELSLADIALRPVGFQATLDRVEEE